MNYPFWDIDIGYGWLMGSIANLHVFISHFAIGGRVTGRVVSADCHVDLPLKTI